MKLKKVIYFTAVACFVFTAVSPDNLFGAECFRNRKKKKNVSIEWSQTKIDSSLNPVDETVTGKIIKKYKPKVDSLDLVVGHTKKELRKNAPESPLSNLAADIVLKAANEYSQMRGRSAVDMSVLNFGGLRAAIIKGDVTVSNIFSVFPFDNRLVIVELKGKHIREMFDKFAKNYRVQPLSGVKVEFKKDRTYNLLIGGKPLDDEKLYKLVTVDFIVQGGDNIFTLQQGERVDETGILIRDAVIKYFKEKDALGQVVDADVDGRVVFE